MSTPTTRHARTGSMPTHMHPRRDRDRALELNLDLVFCSDAEYRARTLSLATPPPPQTPRTPGPTKLVKRRPSTAGTGATRNLNAMYIDISATPLPSLPPLALQNTSQAPSRAPVSPSFVDFDDDASDDDDDDEGEDEFDLDSSTHAPSSSSSSRSRRRPATTPAPGRTLVKLWKGLTHLRSARKSRSVRDSVAFADFEFVTPRPSRA